MSWAQRRQRLSACSEWFCMKRNNAEWGVAVVPTSPSIWGPGLSPHMKPLILREPTLLNSLVVYVGHKSCSDEEGDHNPANHCGLRV